MNMTKIKLVNGAIVNASDVIVANGVLKISTVDLTVEELANLFSDKENTSLITLMTEADVECGYKTGFTSFAGIEYSADGVKTVELFQPVDVTEKRVADAEGKAAQAANTANEANAKTNVLEEQNAVLASTLDSILTDVIPSLMV